MVCQGCRGFTCRRKLTISKVAKWSEAQCRHWLKCHDLVARKVICNKRSHSSPLEMRLSDEKWRCTKKCKGVYDILGPLVPGNAKRTAKQVLKFIILYSRGEPHAVSAEETGLSVTTMVRLRQALDSMIGTIHVLRRIRRHGTLTSMQCDETFFSTRKRGGNNRTRRVRREGPQVAQTIVETTRQNKISEIFMDVVPDRSTSSLIPNIEALGAGSRTRIWTDSARHNLQLQGRYKWEKVVHRREWVTQEGVHTNTVESANSLVKKTLKREGGVLGRGDEKRGSRVRALAEKSNVKLKINGNDALLRMLKNLWYFCEVIDI